MQTFLPYPSFVESAKALDYRRLGKQRLEAFQILKALRDPFYGWQNHPATRQWRTYDNALSNYYSIIVKEWISRGYKNTMVIPDIIETPMPSWFGNDKYHSSHRANLLRKDPIWYGQFGWTDNPSTPYYWPV
jgi:hypothetical protein